MKTTLIALLVLLASVVAVAQTTTFKSTSDNFQISVPAANFKQIRTGTLTTRDGFPLTVTTYAGDNPQGDYIVIVTTYDREITKDRFLELANSQKGELVTSKDDLDFDGQYGVLRLVKTPEGKMANWMTFKGKKFYQIIFGSTLTAEQLNFDEVNAFVDSFKFYGCWLPEGCN
jgi:uncharacterized protein YxeA